MRNFATAISKMRVRTRSKATKKASTLAIDRGRIDRHIKPLLGRMSVVSVTRHDVEKFLHDVAIGRTAGKTKTKSRGLARVTGGETAANWSVGLLGAMFTYAVRKDMRPDNPVRGVTLFERRLNTLILGKLCGRQRKPFGQRLSLRPAFSR